MLMASPPRALPEVTVTAWSGLLVAVTAAVALSRAHPTSGTALLLAAVRRLAAGRVVRRRGVTSASADRHPRRPGDDDPGRAGQWLCRGRGAGAGWTPYPHAPGGWWRWSSRTLLLDAVDGPVARRTGTVTEAGGRLDMQVDAGVLVVLSVAAAPVVGMWVLLIGALRYLFVAASWLRPSLRRPLPRSPFRRVVAGLQGAVLAFAIAPVVPVDVARAALLLALGLLVASFAHQVVLQERQEAGLGMVAEEAPGALPGASSAASSGSRLTPDRNGQRDRPDQSQGDGERAHHRAHGGQDHGRAAEADVRDPGPEDPGLDDHHGDRDDRQREGRSSWRCRSACS